MTNELKSSNRRDEHHKAIKVNRVKQWISDNNSNDRINQVNQMNA